MNFQKKREKRIRIEKKGKERKIVLKKKKSEEEEEGCLENVEGDRRQRKGHTSPKILHHSH